MSRPCQPAASCLLLAMLLCFGVGCDASDVDPEALFALGEYEVGYRSTNLTYARAGTGEPREIPIRVWYPATRSESDRLAVYRAAVVFTVPSAVAWESAALAPGDSFPVVVYGHGGGAEAQHAYPYGEHLASHGFVVIAPEHVGSSTEDALGSFASPVRWALDRPSDVSAALDWLADPDNADFAGRADTDRVAFLGYSMGSYTGYALSGAEINMRELRDACADEACDLLDDPSFAAAYGDLAEPRIAVTVHQASGESEYLNRGALGALSPPAMLFSGSMDLTNPPGETTQPIWEAGSGRYWLRIPAAGHLSFIPTCQDLNVDLIQLVFPDALDDGCGPQSMPVSDALEVLTGYALGFFRSALLGDSRWDPVLAGPPLRAGIEIQSR